MAESPEVHHLGCWYPVGGLDRLCRKGTGGTPTGLCAEHARILMTRRLQPAG